MNYLNIFLIDSGENGAKNRARARTGLKFESREPKIAEPNLLEVSSSYKIILLKMKSLFCLLGAVKSCN